MYHKEETNATPSEKNLQKSAKDHPATTRAHGSVTSSLAAVECTIGNTPHQL